MFSDLAARYIQVLHIYPGLKSRKDYRMKKRLKKVIATPSTLSGIAILSLNLSNFLKNLNMKKLSIIVSSALAND